MLNVLAFLVLSVVGTQPYREAVQTATRENKPIMAIVTATWCLPCQAMKHETIEPMLRSGELSSVVVTYVDFDRDRADAQRLMTGSTVPQIVVLSKASGSWKKFTVVGKQSRLRIQELIRQAKAR